MVSLDTESKLIYGFTCGLHILGATGNRLNFVTR